MLTVLARAFGWLVWLMDNVYLNLWGVALVFLIGAFVGACRASQV